MKKLWGSRFEGSTHSDVETFTSSLSVDARLWSADLKGSVAHAKMLAKTGIITEKEGKTLQDGLKALHEDFSNGKIELDPISAYEQYSKARGSEDNVENMEEYSSNKRIREINSRVRGGTIE